MLVARAGDASFGLLVDAVHEEQELVFEELRDPLREQRTFAGAAILGNGDIVPILDVHALFELASRTPSIAAGSRAASGPPRRASAACSSSRTRSSPASSQKSILIAAGYDAEIAHDGVEAFEMLLQKPWDLVITDVDMPRMDGCELTARLRADERFRNLPVDHRHLARLGRGPPARVRRRRGRVRAQARVRSEPAPRDGQAPHRPRAAGRRPAPFPGGRPMR